jgi:hypothetical protein
MCPYGHRLCHWRYPHGTYTADSLLYTAIWAPCAFSMLVQSPPHRLQDNILVDEAKDHIYICYFDHLCDTTNGSTNHVWTGMISNSAPERLGGQPVTTAADIWAWAGLCYTVTLIALQSTTRTLTYTADQYWSDPLCRADR